MNQARDPEKLKQRLLEFSRGFPFFQLMGFEVADFGPKWAKCQIKGRSELENPNGVIHGGVIATLIDATITQALLMTDEYQQVRDTKGSLSTIDLHVKYLRPAQHGRLICDANIIHLGKRVIHAQAVVRNEEAKEIAHGDASMMIVLGS
ncbi:MAG: PaaI family thioesterase [Polyangiales bacterium]